MRHIFRSLTPMLKTEDIPATVAFYAGVLGFAVDTLWPEEEPTLCILDHGTVSLSFVSDIEAWGADAPAMTGQLTFDVDDVMAVYETVKGHAEVIWGPEVYPYGRLEFSCIDPNGYALVFSQPADTGTDGEA